MIKKVCSFILIVASFFIINCNKDCNRPDRCYLEPDPGPCYASMPKYYFDKEEKKCKEFIWGGCEGVVPFDSKEECEVCECNK